MKTNRGRGQSASQTHSGREKQSLAVEEETEREKLIESPARVKEEEYGKRPAMQCLEGRSGRRTTSIKQV